jgi:hypothetical protein
VQKLRGLGVAAGESPPSGYTELLFRLVRTANFVAGQIFGVPIPLLAGCRVMALFHRSVTKSDLISAPLL